MLIYFSILLWIVLANLTWLNGKLFFIYSLDKKFIHNLIELSVYFLIGLSITLLFEFNENGNLYQKDWEFWSISCFIFIIFSFPGFIYRYLYKY